MIKIIERITNVFFDRLEKHPYTSRALIFTADLINVFFAFTLTYYICFNIIKAPVQPVPFIAKLSLCLCIHGICFLWFRTFRSILRYTSLWDILRIFVSIICANLTLFIANGIIDSYLNTIIFPNIGFLINLALVTVMIIFFRLCVRLSFDLAHNHYIRRRKTTPILIYGINNSNVSLADSINKSPISYNVAGFITTSDSNAQHKRIMGLPVYNKDEIFNNMSRDKYYKAILINQSEIDYEEKQTLVGKCVSHNIHVLYAPTWNKHSPNRPLQVRHLKKVKIEDLLERPPIQIDIDSIAKNLEDKTVLVTGAAGSIGSEIVRQIGKLHPRMIIMLDIAESPLHQLHLELTEQFHNFDCVPVICNTQHYDHLKLIFDKYHPDYVYHAAAYKHVPMMEVHPCEAVLTNVLGSKNAADLAVIYDVEAFVMISTDKAVNPTNVMGATKRTTEIYIQSLARKLQKESSGSEHTRLIITRFGNVLGSNGSVIPRFESQIEKGGPVTVTHPDIIRYFMTIPEACRLVLEAGNFGKGGEVFVFDMGDLVKIKDLAEKMIRLSGLEPYKDIDIQFTGLRAGEKLYEELLYDKEKMKPTFNPKILIGEVREYDYQYVYSIISNLIETAYMYDNTETVRIMKQLVPEYISKNSVYSLLDEESRMRTERRKMALL